MMKAFYPILVLTLFCQIIQAENQTPVPVYPPLTDTEKTEVISLKYRDPENLVVLLKDLVSPRLRLISDPPSRSLIMKGSLAELENFSRIVKQIDVFAPEVDLNFRVIEAKPGNVRPRIQKELEDVATELEKSWNFARYELINEVNISALQGATSVIRITSDLHLNFLISRAIESEILLTIELAHSSPLIVDQLAPPEEVQTVLATTFQLQTGTPKLLGGSRSFSKEDETYIILAIKGTISP